MKTRTMKSILSLVLSLTLAMGLMTSTVFATDIEEPEPDPEATEEDIFEDEEMPEITEEETEPAVEQPDEEEVEAVPADEDEGEEEDPGIQLFAATDEEQTLNVEQKADGDIGDNVSFTYHLYQILEAAETIENMSDITKSEPGANLAYVICDADGNDTSSGTTDSEGTFALQVGETAEFTLDPETNWYVNQETSEAYPLISVDFDGEYAGVVDGTNGVVYYGQIKPEQPTVSVSVSTNIDGNEKTYDGGSVILTADVSYSPDTADVSYQWYKDGEEISGKTENILTLDGNVSDSGTYKCVVTAESDDGTATAEAGVTVTINKAEQDISYEQSTVTKIDYDEDFIIELTKTTVYGQITYTSSDESVATVDPETGEVAIVGPGYTTITATAAETDNYNEASASYILTVSSDEFDWEIDVNNAQTTWDEDKEEYVDDLTYTGDPLELEMEISLTEEEEAELEGISYQWYRYNSETQDFDKIEGATDKAYKLEGDDVNAGDYIYMCMAVVTYKNDYTHTVYGPIEVIIEKVAQEISYEVTEIKKTTADEPFTNELTEITVSEEEGAGITYMSSDETVATVDENGLVTILSDGEVTITATAVETTNYAEATASYTIVVIKTYCIHWMTWDEIIEQCEKDPTVFEDCLEYGCTHSVELTLNSTIAASGYSTVKYAVCIYGINQDTDESGNTLGLTFGPATGANYNNSYAAHLDAPDGDTSQGSGIDGDGAGYLYNSISENYRMWNSSDNITGGWPASQVRAVFNGKDDQTGSYAAYALDASDCLFSCFPSVLQDAIAAKAVKSDTVWDSQTEENNKTTYDKLWLFSGKELYGDRGRNNAVIRTYEGELYQRSTELGITTIRYGGLMNYNETGENSIWWLRSQDTSYSNTVYHVLASGGWDADNVYRYANGLAPGFCLK